MAANRKQRKQVLLVDDDAAFLKVTAIFLERQGFTIRTASRGQMALDMIKSAAPDIMVMDIMMPGLSGFELLEILKQEKICPDLKIVVVTGRTDPLDTSKARNLGAARILNKPYSREDLLEIMQSFEQDD